MQLTATKAPSEEMSLTNHAFMNSREYQDALRYSTLHTGVASYIFRVDPSDKVPPGKIGFGLAQVMLHLLKKILFSNADMPTYIPILEKMGKPVPRSSSWC